MAGNVIGLSICSLDPQHLPTLQTVEMVGNVIGLSICSLDPQHLPTLHTNH